MATFETVRRLALALPGAEEGTSHGTPAFRVRGKLFARLWEGSDVLVLKIDPDYRDMLLQTQPETYFITPHYEGYPCVLVRLACADEAELGALLADSWRICAPKRLAASVDGK